MKVYIITYHSNEMEDDIVLVCSTEKKAQEFIKSRSKRRGEGPLRWSIQEWQVDGDPYGATSILRLPKDLV